MKVLHRNLAKRSKLLSVLGATATIALTAGLPVVISQPVQAQSASCPTVTLPNILGSSVSFSNGRALLTLIRRSRVQGSPAYEVIVNRSSSAGVFVTPSTLIPNQLALRFVLRPNVFNGGRVEQVAVAVACSPWRRV